MQQIPGMEVRRVVMQMNLHVMKVTLAAEWGWIGGMKKPQTPVDI